MSELSYPIVERVYTGLFFAPVAVELTSPRERFGTLASGHVVVADRKRHHEGHLAQLPFLPEALGRIYLLSPYQSISDKEKLAIEAQGLTVIQPPRPGKNCKATIDMGRRVGVSEVVPTMSGDVIYYGKRPDRDVLSRFVVRPGATAPETSLLTVVFHYPKPTSDTEMLLQQTGDWNLVTLATLHPGPAAEREPGTFTKFDIEKDPEGYARACAFWRRHAFLVGG